MRRSGHSRAAFLVAGTVVVIGARIAQPSTARAAVQGSLQRTAPVFDDPAPLVSHDGVAPLSWGGPPGDYEVRLEHDEHARIVYRGRAATAHVSGLREGDYAVRVRALHDGGASPWSAAKLVRVRHHPRSLVYVLVGLGLLTFVGTAGVVLGSSRGAA